MARRAFYSFHYAPDNWRASQVRNIGVIDGNISVSDNDWETITKGGDKAIKAWIDDQMHGKSCVVVLIGSATAGRKWINYEIERGWNERKGVLGINIHNLKDASGNHSRIGINPFGLFKIGNNSNMSSIVKLYNPPFYDSREVYNYISGNIEYWVEEAIQIRKMY